MMTRGNRTLLLFVYLIFALYFINSALSFVTMPGFIESIDRWLTLIGGVLILIGGFSYYRSSRMMMWFFYFLFYFPLFILFYLFTRNIYIGKLYFLNTFSYFAFELFTEIVSSGSQAIVSKISFELSRNPINLSKPIPYPPLNIGGSWSNTLK